MLTNAQQLQALRKNILAALLERVGSFYAGAPNVIWVALFLSVIAIASLTSTDISAILMILVSSKTGVISNVLTWKSYLNAGPLASVT